MSQVIFAEAVPDSGLDGLTKTVLLFGLLVVYFIPTICGWRKRNVQAIFLLNLFLGWTFLGWVIALVWAAVKDPQPADSWHQNGTRPTDLQKPQ